MRYKLFQVDAFTEKVFGGNPAAVCVLENWLSDHLLQQIAAENNLSETAYVVPHADGYCIRWFTPKAEVDLCGHATLAAAFVLYEYYFHPSKELHFCTRNSGTLTVERSARGFAMSFPADRLEEVPLPATLVQAFDRAPLRTYRGRTDYLLEFASQADIDALVPRLSAIEATDCRGVIVTARSEEYDFVSRFFAPRLGIAEDPVTGSAHTSLVPFWRTQLGKTEFVAMQRSARGGVVYCRCHRDRVIVEGQAVCFLEGEFEI